MKSLSRKNNKELKAGDSVILTNGNIVFKGLIERVTKYDYILNSGQWIVSKSQLHINFSEGFICLIAVLSGDETESELTKEFKRYSSEHDTSNKGAVIVKECAANIAYKSVRGTIVNGSVTEQIRADGKVFSSIQLPHFDINKNVRKVYEMKALDLIRQKGIIFTDVKELTDLKEAHINYCKLSFNFEA